MAKVRGFLSGARGKVGDFVLQKGERTTVLRANNGTANPQSAAQMAQRLAFATATNAAKKMLSVIGLSFYGVSDGKLSRRKFVALNVPILKASADAQISGEEWANPTCHFKAKDINQLVPNPYIVSDGSLVLAEQVQLVATDNGLTFKRAENVMEITHGTAQTITGYQLIEQLFGCFSGNQLTLVTIQGKNGEAVPYVYEQGENVTVNGVPMLNYDWQRFTRMAAPRVVFKQNDLPSLEILADETQDTLLPKFVAAIRGCIDMDKSSEDLVSWLTTDVLQLVQEDAESDIYVNFGSPYVQSFSDDYTVLAAGFVRSANIDGVWDFTRTQLVVAMDLDTAGGPADNDSYSGLSIGNAIYTYVGVADNAGKNFMTTGTPYGEMPVQ